MRYNAIIFDMYGTLLDTLDDITDSVNHVIGSFGYPPKSREEIRNYVGNGTARLFEQCFPRKLNDRYFSHMLKMYSQHYLENCVNKTKPYSQILEVLQRLHESDIRLGIVSNKPDTMVKRLNSMFFAKYISVALGELPDMKRKPEPDLVLTALE